MQYPRLAFHAAGDGRPVLFLHGIPGSAHTWDPILQVAERGDLQGIRVIMPDLLGFGRSAEAGDDWYLEGQADAVAELLGFLDISEVDVVAHDFGVPVLMTMSRRHPNIQVRSLLVMSTNLFPDTPIPGPLKAASIPVLGAMIFRIMAGSVLGISMMHWQAVVRKDMFPLSAMRRHAGVRERRMVERIFRHSLAHLRELYQPVFEAAGQLIVREKICVVWGDKDPFFPVATAYKTQRLFHNADLAILQDVGHFVPEERPDVVIDHLRTLSSIDPTLK